MFVGVANREDPDQTASEEAVLICVCTVSRQLVFRIFQHLPCPVGLVNEILVRVYISFGERSGSVVECLSRDGGAAGSSLTGVTALSPSARTLILA